MWFLGQGVVEGARGGTEASEAHSCLVGHANTLWAGPPICAIIPGHQHSHISPREGVRSSDVSALPSPPALGDLVLADLF